MNVLDEHSTARRAGLGMSAEGERGGRSEGLGEGQGHRGGAMGLVWGGAERGPSESQCAVGLDELHQVLMEETEVTANLPIRTSSSISRVSAIVSGLGRRDAGL